VQIINVMAISLDGRIAAHPEEKDQERRRYGLTNEDDRSHVESLIAGADAVVVGAGSLRASGGRVWETGAGRQPLWVVLTRTGLATDLPFWSQSAAPRWLVSENELEGAPRDAGVRLITYGSRSPAQVVRRELEAIGARRVLLFGGGEVNRHFYKERLVDQVILTVSPVILARESAVPLVAPPLPEPVRLELISSHSKGNLVFLTYNVLKN
jgi:5-amino-6-(5-phosphoribosylamino)uracil reductase